MFREIFDGMVFRKFLIYETLCMCISLNIACQIPSYDYYIHSPITFLICAQSFSQVRLFVTSWTVTHQVPPPMGILQVRILKQVAVHSSRGILSTLESNPGLPHCRRILYCLSHQGIFQYILKFYIFNIKHFLCIKIVQVDSWLSYYLVFNESG